MQWWLCCWCHKVLNTAFTTTVIFNLHNPWESHYCLQSQYFWWSLELLHINEREVYWWRHCCRENYPDKSHHRSTPKSKQFLMVWVNGTKRTGEEAKSQVMQTPMDTDMRTWSRVTYGTQTIHSWNSLLLIVSIWWSSCSVLSSNFISLLRLVIDQINMTSHSWSEWIKLVNYSM